MEGVSTSWALKRDAERRAENPLRAMRAQRVRGEKSTVTRE
jgi:hypothetical protein